METKVREDVLKQLSMVLSLYEDLRRRAKHDDLSGPPESEHFKIVSLARASIGRVAGPSSQYMKQFEAIIDDKGYGWIGNRLIAISGVVEALRIDVEAGYLRPISELLHGEVFSDLIEMASYLLDEGYKDPAAIVTGAALETQLRRLAESNAIEVEVGGRSKKADLLNSELTKAEVYTKLDQKNVTAWLDLRNRAAHGHFSEYSREQVVSLLAGVRDFMVRHPA